MKMGELLEKIVGIEKREKCPVCGSGLYCDPIASEKTPGEYTILGHVLFCLDCDYEKEEKK